METRKVKLSEIQQNRGQIEGLPKNPRKWDKEDLERLKRSLEETPELADARGLIVAAQKGKYVVLGGNMRYAAMKALGWEEATVHIVPEGTDLQTLKEIVLKDNRQFGSWDYDELANKWDDKALNDWGVKAWVTPTEETEAGAQEGAQVSKQDQGKETLTPVERIIIVYPKEKEHVLAEIIGVEAIDRIVYGIKELGGAQDD